MFWEACTLAGSAIWGLVVVMGLAVGKGQTPGAGGLAVGRGWGSVPVSVVAVAAEAVEATVADLAFGLREKRLRKLFFTCAKVSGAVEEGTVSDCIFGSGSDGSARLQSGRVGVWDD